MRSPLLFLLAACGLTYATTLHAAGPLRVDLGMDTGRSDTDTPGWTEWQVPDSPEATRDFDGVRVTLRAVGEGATLRGVWNKKLLVKTTMAGDGVTAGDGDLEIQLDGLKPGRHTLGSFHNYVDGPLPENHGIEGQWAFAIDVAVSTDEGASVSALPTAEVGHDDDAGSAYVEFTAKADQPVVVRFEPRDAPVIVNGFEIDRVDPSRKTIKPSPSNFDWHVNADKGEVQLSWAIPWESGHGSHADRFEVYLAADSDPAKADQLAESADRGSTAYRGVITESRSNGGRGGFDGPPVDEWLRASLGVPIDANDSHLHYRWRVDSVDTAGKVTKGDIWAFRPRHLAFPGAEGYGRFAIGGRGGKVVKVTNLNDSGPGSLRAAVELNEPRTVVFDVSGKIVLKSTLGLRNPYLTIAGQTAPGKGICIANYNMGALGSHDLIVRYMRVRPGNTSGDTLDGMGMASTTDAIYDHCSISWTQDESFSSRGAGNITLQRTLISEALNVAGHRNYEAGKQHGFAASIGGDIGSFHHNLLAHCAGRNWSLAGGLDKATRHTGRLDIRNNVVYNWSHRTTDGGAAQVNFVNNYYKPGPASKVFHVLMAEREAVQAFGPQMYYVDGNVMEGRFSAGERYAGVFERRREPIEDWTVDEPFYESFVTTQSAEEAFNNVLNDVGCNVPALDEHDQRVIRETRDGTTTYKGSKSGLPGLPDTQDDVGGWDEYPEVHRAADWDPDNDGMPSSWETEQGFNPADPSDAGGDKNGDGYTNLEEYLNSLVR